MDKMTSPVDEMDAVVAALEGLRVSVIGREVELQTAIESALANARIIAKREVVLGPRCRVDFLTATGVAIEIKKGKPNCRQLAEQAARYAEWPSVSSIVLVVERNAWQLPRETNGKLVRYVSLNRNWGIAL